MEGDVQLTSEEAAWANRIKQIDSELDAIEEQLNKSVQWGLHGSGSGVGALMRDKLESSGDEQYDALLLERKRTATELKRSIEGRSV